MLQPLQQQPTKNPSTDEKKQHIVREVVRSIFNTAISGSNRDKLKDAITKYRTQLIAIEKMDEHFSCVEKVAMYTPSDELVTLLESDPDFKKLGDVFSAAYFGKRDFFETYTGDINAAIPSSGYTAMHFACTNNQIALVRYLIEERGASVDTLSYSGIPPIMIALKYNNAKLVEALHQGEANFEIEFSVQGVLLTPLIIAASYAADYSDGAEMLNLLSQYTPSLTKKLQSGETVAERLMYMNAIHGVALPEALMQRIKDATKNKPQEEKSISKGRALAAKPEVGRPQTIPATSIRNSKKKKSKAEKKAALNKLAEAAPPIIAESTQEQVEPKSSPAKILSNLQISVPVPQKSALEVIASSRGSEKVVSTSGTPLIESTIPNKPADSSDTLPAKKTEEKQTAAPTPAKLASNGIASVVRIKEAEPLPQQPKPETQNTMPAYRQMSL